MADIRQMPRRVIWMIILFFVGAALIVGVILAIFVHSGPGTGYDGCVKAGNPVQQGYPETCHAGDKVFVNPNQVVN